MDKGPVGGPKRGKFKSINFYAEESAIEMIQYFVYNIIVIIYSNLYKWISQDLWSSNQGSKVKCYSVDLLKK